MPSRTAGVDRYACVPRALAALSLLLVAALPLAVRAADAPSNEPELLGEEPILSYGPLEYRPGRGLRLGDTGGVIGGFTTVKVEHTDAGGEFALDNLNFFLIFDRFTRFRAVAELQLKDIFVADSETAGTQDFAFDVRRLFGDFTAYDWLRLRAGTFLTPVGYWNLILAPPLTWTTEPPLIVEETFFQQTTTGFMTYGSTGVGPGQLGYAAFSQFLKPLEDDPDLEPPDHTAGFRLTYEDIPEWSGSVTYQYSETDGDTSNLGAFSLVWQARRCEVLAELYVQDFEPPDTAQWGTYLQGVIEVYRPFYVVGRYEHYDPPPDIDSVNLFTIGGVWKPFPFMAVKAEYRFADRDLEDEDLEGFFASFTTFF